MSHRKHDNSPAVNQNWIKDANLKSWKATAKQLAEKHHIWESLHTFKTVVIDRKTIILKLVK